MCDDERGLVLLPKNRLWLHVSSSSLSVFPYVACEDGMKEDALTAFTEEHNFFFYFLLFWGSTNGRPNLTSCWHPDVKLMAEDPHELHLHPTGFELRTFYKDPGP
jgi:hypothetical protein